MAIDYYCSTPKLQTSPIGTQNIHDISINDNRYSIKSTSSDTTSSSILDTQKFEYAVIVKFDKEYQLEGIYELSWNTFIKHKDGIVV